MTWDFMFFFNSALLGVGLAMDAFSVSIANALNEPHISRMRGCAIAGVYAAFQFAMPMVGWLCVHSIAETFTTFQTFIPWIALILLLFIGGKMVWETIRGQNKFCKACSKAREACANCPHRMQDDEKRRITFGVLMLQGIATSIDALSVGFAIASYDIFAAFIASLIIAVVTFIICLGGLSIGKVAGQHLSSHAQIVGGLILIGIGIEIFVRGIFF